MFKLRLFGTCLAVCFVMMHTTAMAVLVNGDFEATTGGLFDGWSTVSVDAAYTVATDPMNIDGTNSARIIAYGKGNEDYNDAGTLKQTFDVAGLSDFQIDFDFSFLDCNSTDREFSLFTYAADGTTLVDNLAIKKSTISGNHVLLYNGTTATQGRDWRSGGLTANVTSDINTLYSFDGETPEVNHITMVGRGYGTDDYSLVMAVNGSTPWVLTDHIRDANNAISTLAFFGRSSSIDSDFLVDNVVVQEYVDNNTDPLNGNFESVIAGSFPGWETGNSNKTYTVATSPLNIDGDASCQMLHGSTEGGILKRQFDTEGLSNFRVEMDLAFLVEQSTGSSERLFSVITYGADGSTVADSLGILGAEAQLKAWNNGAWEASGAFADPTLDTGTSDSFDGETPVVNHLVLEGEGYGTENYSLTVTLTGDYTYTHTYTNHLGAGNSVAPGYIAFYGGGCVSDFLVDNITVEAISERIPGDANRDGKVDGSDVTILAGNWQVLTNATWDMGDFNGDGKVDGSDVTILAGNWQYGVTTNAASVPEPSSITLLLAGVISCLAFNRKRIMNKRFFNIAMLVLCLFGLNKNALAEDYGFDYPLIFDFNVRPTAEGDAISPLTTWPYGFHAVETDITPVALAGTWYNALDWRVRGCLTECYNQNRPVAILLGDSTGPYDGSVDPNALTKIMDYLSYKGMRLDYVFMDIEGATQAENTALVNQLVRNYSDPNINQARMGNYHDDFGTDICYQNSGMDVAMPTIYQWQSYASTFSGPNDRADLFYGALEHLSTSARNLRSGDQLIPWVGNYVGTETTDPLPHEDSERLLQHCRLRGANGYYNWRSSQEDWYDPTYPGDIYGTEAFKAAMVDAWQELDWLFDGIDKDDINVLSLATDESSGFNWSAVETANGAVLLASNLGNSTNSVTAAELLTAGMSSQAVTGIFGSTSGQIYVTAGNHSLETYSVPSVAIVNVPEPSSLWMLASVLFVLIGYRKFSHR